MSSIAEASPWEPEDGALAAVRRHRRNTAALIVSGAAHLVFLALIVNQSSTPYTLPSLAPAAELPAPAMEVQIIRPPRREIARVTAPLSTTIPPAPNWPKPERTKVLPPLPSTPAPAPLASPPVSPAPTTLAASPKITVLSRRKILQAAPRPGAAPLSRTRLMGALDIHVPALAPPSGVPTLPMSPSSPKAGSGLGGARLGSASGSRGVGLSPSPYGFMPSGGAGLRGTLVGCANADAVRLSAAERDRCNERLGANIDEAPKLDPIAAKRAAFDQAAARDIREQKYRASTTDMNHDPSLPGGIASGPASSETFKHNAGDPK